MTSPEAAGATARRGDVQLRMFNWSKGHVTVRDLISRQIVEVPTVVRVATSYVSDRQSRKYNFREGTLYLVRSVVYYPLVVARTADGHYVTVPRDSPLLFHLVSNDNTLANAALTLGDILGGDTESVEEGPCNGQRVQLSSQMTTLYPALLPWEAQYPLSLEDVYKEKFLVCHAFVAGSLSSKVTMIPGYLPLKLHITRSMTTGRDLTTYISRLCQLVENNLTTDAVSRDPLEISVFSEPPNNHYEWIEPPLSDAKPKSTTPPPPAAPPKPFATLVHSQSNLYFGDRPVVTIATHTKRHDGGRLSLDNNSKRPLPPVPVSLILTESERTLQGRNTLRLFNKKTDTSRSNTAKVHMLVGGQTSKSNPLSRSGSEPNLLDVEKRPERLSSSQSLEDLSTEVPPQQTVTKSKDSISTARELFFSLPRRIRPSQFTATSASKPEIATKSEALPTSRTRTVVTSRAEESTSPPKKMPLRPSPPTRPSNEEIVYNFKAKSKQNSMIRRQRPITPGMKLRSGNYQSGAENPDSPEPSTGKSDPLKEVYIHKAGYYMHDTNSSQIVRPRHLELQRTSAVSPGQNQQEEGIYDSIASPTYTDMSRQSTSSAAQRTSQTSFSYSTVRPNTEVTDPYTASHGAIDTSDYVNASEVRKTFSAGTPEDRHSITKTHPPENSEQKEASIYLVDDDDGAYCMPQNTAVAGADDAERGQGVGAEMEDRSHYAGQPATVAINLQATTPSKPAGSQPQSSTTPLEVVAYSSLDEIPSDMRALSVEEVLQCLRWLNLQKHVERFRSEQIDGELLMSVDQQVLIEELGFKRFDAIKLEKFARHGWRPKLVRAAPIQSPPTQQSMLIFSQGTEPLYTDV